MNPCTSAVQNHHHIQLVNMFSYPQHKLFVVGLGMVMDCYEPTGHLTESTATGIHQLSSSPTSTATEPLRFATANAKARRGSQRGRFLEREAEYHAGVAYVGHPLYALISVDFSHYSRLDNHWVTIIGHCRTIN